jgi:hypothetical protein
MTNDQRKLINSKELKLSPELSRLASHKASVYWELEKQGLGWDTSSYPLSVHNLNGRDWMDIYRDCPSYIESDKYYSENVSRKGLPISNVVLSGWMQSDSHRAAILDPRWNRVGIYSYCKPDTTTFPYCYHIQLFSN